MKKIEISPDLREKIYDFNSDNKDQIITITSFFPLKLGEKQEITNSLDKIKDTHVNFKSIFSDDISEQEWMKNKEQIKKKFQDELMGID